MASGGPVVVTIDAYSDLACPWCYVGKARLDQAIAKIESGGKSPPAQVVVKWHPYMIDLKTNPAGEEYLAYNERRWGSDGWTQSLRRLIDLAERYGKSAEMKQLLLQKTYESGQNISDVEVLASAAEELGIPGADEYLRSNNGRKEVLDQDKLAKSKLGIGSVPHFILENRYSLSGAQDVDTFESALQKVVELRRQQET